MHTIWISLVLSASSLMLGGDGDKDDWPSYRGPKAQGVAEGYSTSLTWSLPENRNVAWKTQIPGLGHSSPVISGNRMFITTAVKDGESTLKVGLYGAGDSVEDEGKHRFLLMCLDTGSGKVLWERTAFEGSPRIKRHPKSSHANSTPATDGRYVVAFFASEGLYCYTVDGDLVWKKDLGVLNAGAPGFPRYQWGFASSPVIHNGHLILQCDVQGQSFITKLDLATGETIWRTDRDEDPTWGTPAIDVREGRSQVICNGYKRIGGYDLQTGKELWNLHGGGDVPVPTPVVAFDLIFITNAHGRQSPIYAIKPGVTGTISDDPEAGHMAWSTRKFGNYMQTPLIYGNELYCCRDNGILSCYDAKSGTPHYRKRLGSGGSGFSASTVAADGKVYVTSEDGEIYVIKAGMEFEVLAVNEMGETCMATPAISRGTLYFRTRNYLVAIAERQVPLKTSQPETDD